MNTSSSDFSSGCESGWTQYFVRSSSSKSRRTGSKKMMHNKGYEGGEEDMSMVSDASSGPRQYNEEEEEEQYNEDFNRNEYSSFRNNEQKMNKKGKQRDRSQTADTANSHSKNNQPSMYYSTSYVQENSGASLSKAKPTRKKYFGS